MFKALFSKRRLRRDVLLGASAMTLAALAPGVSLAADAYPSHPITLILAYPPGGGVDMVGRLLARELERNLGQNVIVENRPGAGSLIGTSTLIRSKPDGYTIMLADPALVINESLMKHVTYDSQKDLVPISTVTSSPLVLAVPTTSKIKSVADLVEAGKGKGAGLSFASAGLGSTPHMAGELLKLRSQSNFVHVPYKGSGPAMTDLISGQVDFAFATQSASAQYIAGGRLRGLATTGAERSPLLPELPTMADSLPGFRVLFWTALIAPAGTPPDIQKRLNDAVKASLASPTMKSGLEKAGEVSSYMSLADCKAFFTSERDMWSKVVRESKLELE
ncbi:tripartite tricarboxylate transporter substrate binding protein [Bordetella sp. N]|uniref:Bug family tripartite tricarboxylate transporter substrate binding protein n=1 Tax=Bordetella sp. N TaxID=1746199 RepID=UPI00071073B6|nr:tripartite tricarboxylate transporter substrate binding protein [Bordetella sp. N]ALM82222.1 hypothetical protein ASB57_03940 [Bordetella sp. N]